MLSVDEKTRSAVGLAPRANLQLRTSVGSPVVRPGVSRFQESGPVPRLALSGSGPGGSESAESVGSRSLGFRRLNGRPVMGTGVRPRTRPRLLILPAPASISMGRGRGVRNQPEQVNARETPVTSPQWVRPRRPESYGLARDGASDQAQCPRLRAVPRDGGCTGPLARITTQSGAAAVQPGIRTAARPGAPEQSWQSCQVRPKDHFMGAVVSGGAASVTEPSR